MGNGESKQLKLNPVKRDDANDGVLFAYISDAWQSEFVSFDGAFEELAKYRRGKAPDDIRKLAEVCCEAWDRHEDTKEADIFVENFMKTVEEIWINLTSSLSGQGPQGRNTEQLNKDERRAAQNVVNMFGEKGKHTKTRVHQVPSSSACHVFWGFVCEVAGGMDLSGFDEQKKKFVRTEMARWLCKFKLNLFAFANPHNSFYDLLWDGECSQCVMIIPLLSLEEIGEWKQGDGYQALICCSTPDSQANLGKWRKRFKLDHIFWERNGDIEQATTVLNAHVKALADSLIKDWDSYFDKVDSDHPEFPDKKQKMKSAKELLVGQSFTVEVSKLKPARNGIGLWQRKKFFKIDMGKLYSGDDTKKLIPDPSLLSFKAAVNWSGRTEETKKLLTCCSPPDDESAQTYLSGIPSKYSIGEAVLGHKISQYGVEHIINERNKFFDAELLDKEFHLTGGSGDENSSVLSDVSWGGPEITEDSFGGIPVVSEDSSNK
ncbi:expressed unknown protein [Seminavis robusta]|uniref:Uncharacterized protein n=2 Tax=Seminavis robusta TaxID=568900 RepID=A0A9N8F183_9STRA|nr:expressed unknown protein [Seminavis robusta]|eukprot:Sro2580_g331850.1 n/a (489) ;mRNA; f:7842-9308